MTSGQTDVLPRLGFYQVQPALDSLNSLLKAIEAPIHARHSFFDVGDSHLQILHVPDEQIDALFNTRQARLNLLQHRHHEVGDLAHSSNLYVLAMFLQGAREFR